MSENPNPNPEDEELKAIGAGLPAPKPAKEVQALADVKSQTEAELYRLEELKAKVKKLTIDNRSREQDILDRRIYGAVITVITIAWLVVVLVYVNRQGRGEYKLSDSVMVALLSTTSVNVIALFASVAKYLYFTGAPERKKTGDGKKSKAKTEPE